MPLVGFEQTGATADRSGLEQPDDHRQERESARIVGGTGDQSEHLQLAFDGGAVVGEHVDPVVLGEVRRCGTGRTREPEPAGFVEPPDVQSQRPFRTVGERLPSRCQRRVVADRTPRTVDCRSGMQHRRRARGPPCGVSAALEVDERKTPITVRQILQHREHVVAHPHCRGTRRDLLTDLRWERIHDQCSEDHRLQDPFAEDAVAAGQRIGEAIRPQRSTVIGPTGHHEPGHGLDRGGEHHLLQR